jgi:hypothetical protein
MATKKTTDKKTEKTTKAPSKKAVPKKAPKKASTAKSAKKEPKKKVEIGPRHPAARVKAGAGSKEALAKSIAGALAHGDDDADTVADRLKTASNSQLLRLQKVTETVKSKYGSRAGLIEAIGKFEKKQKDKDFISKLESLSLPNLLDIAQQHAN